MTNPRILFMGTPDFAVPALEMLVRRGCTVIGVVTQPDRPKGRGRQPAPPPVKATAEKYGIPVMQPDRVRDEAFLKQFRVLAPDMVVLVAFGQILPGEIIDAPPLGCLNVHPSLLPKYRGAAPLNWTLISGETRTGVTIMQMDEGVDSGDILLQEETDIPPDETFGTLHDRLSIKGAELLGKTIDMVLAGAAVMTPQDASAATYAPRLKKEDGLIHWDQEASDIVNLIRGLAPAPCAYTILDGRQMKVFAATAEQVAQTGSAGAIGPLGEQGLPVASRNGNVYLREVQMENKKRMSIHDFLRGYRIASSAMC